MTLFGKYLIRSDTNQYIVSTVKDDRKAIIKTEKRNIRGKEEIIKDFSNFGKETYHPTFASCLKKIRELELLNSDCESLAELIGKLYEIDEKIEDIQRRFNK